MATMASEACAADDDSHSQASFGSSESSPSALDDAVVLKPCPEETRKMTLSCRPDNEGDDVRIDTSVDVDGMQKWCKDNVQCVGASHPPHIPPQIRSSDKGILPQRPSEARQRFIPEDGGSGVCSQIASSACDADWDWDWYFIEDMPQPIQAAKQEGPPTRLVNNPSSKFRPLPDRDVVHYLQERGFSALDCACWQLSDFSRWEKQMPSLSMSVSVHEEAGAHTWYSVECSLTKCSRSRRWVVPRRLKQLRHLRNAIAASLGEKTYRRLFRDEHGVRICFARRGAPRGTTSRLDSWLGQLSYIVNSAQAPPTVIALVLYFLHSPCVGQYLNDMSGGLREGGRWDPSSENLSKRLPNQVQCLS